MTKELFTASDYPRILKAIELKYIMPLNLEPLGLEDKEEDEIYELLEEGNVPMDYDHYCSSLTGLSGNLSVYAMRGLNGADLSWQESSEEIGRQILKNTRIFTKENAAGDQETYVELTSYPMAPYDEDELQLLFKNTSIGQLLTIDEFRGQQAIMGADGYEERATWIEECFAGCDAYDVVLDVIAAGQKPTNLDDFGFEHIGYFETPLTFSHQGKDYDLHIFEHSD